MLFNLLESTASIGERAADGAITFLIGMVVIFLGMTVLILCVTGFGKIADAIAKRTEKKAETKKEEVKTEITVSDDEIPEDIRVAIIAAVSAYYAESGSKNEFTVKKIKRI